MEAAVLGIIGVIALAMYWKNRKAADESPALGEGDIPVAADTDEMIDEAPGGIQPDIEDVATLAKEQAADAVLQTSLDNANKAPAPSIQKQPNRVSPEDENVLARENIEDAVEVMQQPLEGDLSALTVATGQFTLSVNDDAGARAAKNSPDTTFSALDLAADGVMDVPPSGGSPYVE